jgi:hypothetical protein
MHDADVADRWPYSWPYMVIEAIDSLGTLSTQQRELLREVAAEHPGFGGDLAVYWLRDAPARPPHAVVAPISDDLKTGDKVVAKDWSTASQDVLIDGASGESSLVELQASGRLVHAASSG